ncbi:hypothetical protein MMC06_000911 [Schaereria dolodes]|nr:hypothetical protein [Schaereria dolodes]
MRSSLTFAGLVFALNAALSHAAGCSNCGGFPLDQITSGCRDKCTSILQFPAPAAVPQCQVGCDILVNSGHCCTTTICSSSKVRFARDAGDIVERAVPSDVQELWGPLEGTSPSSAPQARSQDEVEGEAEDEEKRSLVARDFTACCNAAKAAYRAASLCHNRAGTIAQAAALAAGLACGQIYGGVCNAAA